MLRATLCAVAAEASIYGTFNFSAALRARVSLITRYFSKSHLLPTKMTSGVLQ